MRPARARRPGCPPGETITLPVQDALAQLPVRTDARTGYERTAFKHWVDADRDGCNTRAEVLKAEAVIAPEQGASCRLSGGEWYSAYDDRYVTGPSGLDIDHLVPLAEAWDSGACAWSAAEREAYANDLGDDRPRPPLGLSPAPAASARVTRGVAHSSRMGSGLRRAVQECQAVLGQQVGVVRVVTRVGGADRPEVALDGPGAVEL
ncbi:HNH endonuclease [Streptomyces longwoodensis]